MALAVAENVLAQMLYVYAPLSDAELKQYVDFLASPPGRSYGRIAHSSLLRVVREVADRTAFEVLRVLRPSAGRCAKDRGSSVTARSRSHGRPLALTTAGGVGR